MKVEFITSPEEIRAGDALQVILPMDGGPYPRSHFEDCQKAAGETGSVVCTAPFENGGHISMAYISGGDVVLQHACFQPRGQESRVSGENVVVFETPMGRLAMACGVDSLQPQYARTAALRGCSLLVCGLWLSGERYLMAGPWSGAQANCMAMAAAQPEGGKLVLPCALTQDFSGFGLKEFEPEELARAYADFPVFDCMDMTLYMKYKEELMR